MQTADCRLQTGYKMQTKHKMLTADCRLGIKCRLRLKPPLRQIHFEFFNLTYASVILLKEPITGISGVHFNKKNQLLTSNSSLLFYGLTTVQLTVLNNQLCVKLDSTHFYTG